jgi:hypothetical protein
VQATKEMGFDDEDLKILGEVGNYRFGSIMVALKNENIPVPAHAETKFDDQKFLTLLRGPMPLTRDELQKILEEERRKFSELSPKHLLQLQKLEQKHAEDWRDLQAISVQQAARGQEQDQAEQIRKQLGL